MNQANLKTEFRPQLIPQKPGIYIYRDRFGTVIYVGKALNLRNRMSQYFQQSRERVADSKLRSLIHSIEFFEFHVVKSEDEALILESQLIKQYMPRYNILMRDDKRFPLLRIDLKMQLPRLELCRFNRNDGALYFGPFPHGSALRETMRFLNRYFKLRVCKVEHPDEATYKHCLSAIVKDCSCPCVKKVSVSDYQMQIQNMISTIEGSITPLTDFMHQKMKDFAQKQQFEHAARWRDMLQNIESVFGQKMRNFRYARIRSPQGDEAIRSLQEVLELAHEPHHIEGFDNSHFGGKFAVSSMVCFIDGKPAPQKYRRFKLRENEDGIPDDYAAMNEILTRHYTRKLAENQPMPDLILIDGGKGQLHSAMEVLQKLHLEHVPLASLAKQNEEIFIPSQEKSILLDRHSPALRLLQAIRDEAHRFCITYNRALRNEKIRESQLDFIEGIGDKRKQQLLQHFGSVRELKKATSEEISISVPGIGITLAQTILEKLK